MNKKLMIYAVLVVVVVLGVNRYFPMQSTPEAPSADAKKDTVTNKAVEEYVKLHITDLSSEKAVLGGTHFVTKIEVSNGKGVVEYEDGHNAFTADFTYSVDATQTPTITSFVVRPL